MVFGCLDLGSFEQERLNHSNLLEEERAHRALAASAYSRMFRMSDKSIPRQLLTVSSWLLQKRCHVD